MNTKMVGILFASANETKLNELTNIGLRLRCRSPAGTD